MNYYFSENYGLQNDGNIACPKNGFTTVFVAQSSDQPIKRRQRTKIGTNKSQQE